jgi:translation initiation factor 1
VLTARGKLVFSSGPAGRGQGSAPAGESEQPSVPPDQQQIRVRRSSAGRGGKTVTLAQGFRSSEREVSELLRALKQQCAVGGTYRKEGDGFTLELQGEQVDRVVQQLKALGFRAKRAGC